MTSKASAASSGRIWEWIVYSAQFFFGGWFVFHGLNHWMHFFPQPPGAASVSSQLISALIASGLFDWVKAVEVVAGLALLANRFVPLAAIASFPISIVIGYLNIAIENDANSLYTFFGVLGLNLLIVLGHLDRVLPLFATGNIAPSLAGLKNLLPVNDEAYGNASHTQEGAFSATPRKPLKAWTILLCAVLGTALPVYLTLSTLPQPGEPGAALPASVQSAAGR